MIDSEMLSQLWLQEQEADENTWDDMSSRELVDTWESLLPGEVNMLRYNDSSFTTE